jgi:hypothetical protein
VLGLLCRRCFRIGDKKRMAKLIARRASHEGGFVVFTYSAVGTFHQDAHFRLIDFSAEKVEESELDFARLRSQVEDLGVPTFDEGGDWRDGEFRMGASASNWLEPRDHLPPSWER